MEKPNFSLADKRKKEKKKGDKLIILKYFIIVSFTHYILTLGSCDYLKSGLYILFTGWYKYYLQGVGLYLQSIYSSLVQPCHTDWFV